MAGHKHISESEAKRMWLLHKKGLKPSEIAFAVERNVQSVYRVVALFEKAEKGEWEEIESKLGKNKNLCSLARTLFGATEAEEPAPEKTQPAAAAPDNTARYLVSVLTELRRNNELLEKLCKAWEVQP